MVASLAAESSGKVDADTQALIDLIVSWDGKADMENRAAALAIFTGQAAMGSQIHDAYDHDKALAALKSTAALLKDRDGTHRSEMERSQPREARRSNPGPRTAARTCCAPSPPPAI